MIHRIFERFYERMARHGTRAARPATPSGGCARSRARSATPPGDRGETGYPAMWEADRVELIEDCVRWLEARARGRAHPPHCRWSRSRRGSASAGRGEAGDAVADRADRDRAALRRAAPARAGSTGSTGTSRTRGSASSTTRAAGSTRRASPASYRAGGCCSCRCTCSPASQLLGIDPAGGRRRTCIRHARAGSRRSSGRREDIAARHDDVIALLDTIVDAPRERRLHHRAVGGRVPMLRRSTRCAAARTATTRSARRATSGSPDSRPRSGASSERELRDRAARERIVGDLGREPLRRGRRRAPGKTTVLVERVDERCSRAVPRPSISWW